MAFFRTGIGQQKLYYNIGKVSGNRGMSVDNYTFDENGLLIINATWHSATGLEGIGINLPFFKTSQRYKISFDFKGTSQARTTDTTGYDGIKISSSNTDNDARNGITLEQFYYTTENPFPTDYVHREFTFTPTQQEMYLNFCVGFTQCGTLSVRDIKIEEV